MPARRHTRARSSVLVKLPPGARPCCQMPSPCTAPCALRMLFCAPRLKKATSRASSAARSTSAHCGWSAGITTASPRRVSSSRFLQAAGHEAPALLPVEVPEGAGVHDGLARGVEHLVLELAAAELGPHEVPHQVQEADAR